MSNTKYSPKSPFRPVPDFQAASLTTESLDLIVKILKKHNVSEVKFTNSRKLGVKDVDNNTLKILGDELASLSTSANKTWITTLQACPGTDWCKYGIRNSHDLAEQLEKIQLKSPMPAKIKIGIAGCHMCCTEPFVRDIGIIAERKGWKLIFGGNAGGRARVGNVIGEGLNDDEVIELIHRCLILYQENAGKKMRTARFIESYGIKNFINKISG